MEKNKKSQLFKFYGKISLKELVPLGLQHVVAMIVGCVTPAIIVASAAGLDATDKILLVQSSLVFSGIATLIQIFAIGRKIGSKLPIIMGVSFAYVPTLTAIAGEFNMATIFGAQICGGVVAIIFGLFSKKLTKFFPPIVTGTVIFAIGLSLYSTAVKYIAGGVGNEGFGSPLNWLIAVITLSVVIFLNFYTKGTLKLASILCGIIVGYIISLLLGMVSFVEVGEASCFQMPKFMHFGLSFNATAIISMVVMHIVNSVQAIGDLSATTNGAMNREATDEEISGGIVGNGISSILGSLFGCMPTATFSQNVGIVTMNKVINRGIFIFASIVIILSGLIPKFSSILISIPQCVLGGATITVFATITMTGIKMISASKLTTRNTTIVGLAIALGTGIVQVEGSLGLFPTWAISIFGKSSIVVTTLVAITLNLILPKEENNDVKVKVEESDKDNIGVINKA
ncbi:nucleobase:cation symporter-2 family protein [Clostridium sp. D53t1_180928_C8]|uniref:uracil-xanthine permease family protein n=1 Tax=Clostridium sp. D53t1_180928_C8 TaxID=2787101 RepID=UPI0018AC3565|nr:nucleobase:cation symporter-2 family protein [Clostridium sp. D53t1_180928_C8]